MSDAGQLRTTLQALIDEEAARTRNAGQRYGSFVELAQSAIGLLNAFVVGIDRDHFLTAALMLSVQKSATLGFLSHVRAHTAQAEFNSRQLIEFCALAAYMLAHPDEDVTSNADEGGGLQTSKSLTDKAYRWLDREHDHVSALLKDMKKQINDTASHASIYLTCFTFEWESSRDDSEIFCGSFFDQQDDDVVRLYLASHARLVLLVIETLRQVAVAHGGFTMVEDIDERLALLDRDINAHRDALRPRLDMPG
ncbi:MAG: hypothetical protein ACREB7_08635 [Sphingopyxis sp.]|uniref:hypothetical protein n=1 Tax=Sphingopyxis sp. TaxID=1908224 RepID=UPI003D6D710C